MMFKYGAELGEINCVIIIVPEVLSASAHKLTTCENSFTHLYPNPPHSYTSIVTYSTCRHMNQDHWSDLSHLKMLCNDYLTYMIDVQAIQVML